MLLSKRIASLALCLLMLSSYGCVGRTPADTSDMSNTAADTADPDAQTDGDTPDAALYVNADFSLPGGFYASSQKLSLSLPQNAPDGAYITYTENGDEPGAGDKRYTTEITVPGRGGSVVIRAACFSSDGKNIGRIKTNTYIAAQSGRYSTLVVSISSDSEYLYGSDGIISNPTNSGKLWERPCHVEIFTKDGEDIVSQDAGLRIFGGSSRVLEQKSFRLVARNTGYYSELLYNGKGSFEYPFFPQRLIAGGEGAGSILTKYDRLILRNGGNDSLQSTAADEQMMTLTRDGAANNFAARYAPSVQNQHSRFAVVYLNGEYYGILDMKEDINDDYIGKIYGIENEDDITVVKSELDSHRACTSGHGYEVECGRYCGAWFYYEVDSGKQSDLDEFIALCKKAVASTEVQRAAVYEEVCESIDIENFIQYTALNMYICNTDWAHNNVKLWKYSGASNPSLPMTDGKWRFAMRDCDFAFGRYQSSYILPELYTLSDMNTFDFVLSNYYSGTYVYEGNYADPLYLKGLLDFCLRNDEFRTRFIEYCNTLCSEAAEAYLIEVMNTSKNEISGEIANHIDRWSSSISRGYSARTWTTQTAAMVRWAQQRPARFAAQLDEAMKNYI